MENSDFNKTVSALGREVVLIESRAHELPARFQTLRTKTELLKIDILKRGLENRTKSLARQAGFKSIARDGKKLGVGLGGVLTRDGLSALQLWVSTRDERARRDQSPDGGMAVWQIQLRLRSRYQGVL